MVRRFFILGMKRKREMFNLIAMIEFEPLDKLGKIIFIDDVWLIQ